MIPQVSLIVTAHNHARHIGRAIESVLAQTYKDFDLLIWDDGSTDKTSAIVCKCAKKDKRIRLVFCDHRGPVRALKGAIEDTFSPYVGWIENGIPHPEALEKALSKLECDPAIDVVFSRNENHSIDAWDSISRKPQSKDELLHDLMAFSFFLMRRNFYSQADAIVQRRKQ